MAFPQFTDGAAAITRLESVLDALELHYEVVEPDTLVLSYFLESVGTFQIAAQGYASGINLALPLPPWDDPDDAAFHLLLLSLAARRF